MPQQPERICQAPDPHPYADVFPLLAGDELASLTESISRNGLLSPIVILHGKVLDGRNRLAACRTAGVEPRFEDYAGDDPLEFVIAANLDRRHLNTSQRSVVGAEAARLRNGEVGNGRGRGAEVGAQNCAPTSETATQQEAAERMHVSRRSVQQARSVLDNAEPELLASVRAGQIPVSVGAQIAAENEELQLDVVERVQAGERPSNAARAARRAQIRVSPPPPLDADGLYDVIYADPPWRYQHAATDARRIENHYPTMSAEELAALQLPAAQNCVLFLWTTAPMIVEAIDLLPVWEFDYRSQAVWDKQRIGTGYWFRNQHELLLVATRGNPSPPDPEVRVSSVIRDTRGEHSVKPEVVYEIIERCYPSTRRIEMFARQQRDGWTAWGNQAEHGMAAS